MSGPVPAAAGTGIAAIAIGRNEGERLKRCLAALAPHAPASGLLISVAAGLDLDWLGRHAPHGWRAIRTAYSTTLTKRLCRNPKRRSAACSRSASCPSTPPASRPTGPDAKC